MAKEIRNENAEAVVEAVSKTEKFFNENGKLLAGICAGVVVACAAVFCWVKFVHQPKVAEAQGQMAYAEQTFRNGNYEAALNGDGDDGDDDYDDDEPMPRTKSTPCHVLNQHHAKVHYNVIIVK